MKNNEGTIGVTAAVDKGNCTGMMDVVNHVSSIVHWSQLEGKRTGIVTTTRVTHASPAGKYMLRIPRTAVFYTLCRVFCCNLVNND